MDERQRDDYFARACRAVEYADAHLGDELDLAALADAACFSPRHFHRIFTSMLGETPDDCVRRLRLEKAAGMILMSDAPTMTEISLSCGFSTPALFSRNFARHFGSSPTEWRDGMKRQDKVKHRQMLVSKGKDPRSSFSYLVGEDEERVDVEVLTLGAQRVWCVPYLQGYDAGVSKAFARLIRWARPRGLLEGASRIVAIPFDNPAVTPLKRCRNYAGVIPDPSAPEPAWAEGGLVRVVELSGGTYLRAGNAGEDWNLHRLYRLLYEVAVPELGFTSFGAKGFIEYPGRAQGTAEPCPAWGGSLVHVPVRPA